MTHQSKSKNPSKTAVQNQEVGYRKPPMNRRFGQPEGNSPYKGGTTPKYVKDVRVAIRDLLDPNLTLEDYERIAKRSKSDSGIRGLFALAIIKKDYKTVLKLIEQGYGKANNIDITSNGNTLSNPLQGLTVEELKKLANEKD